MSAPDPARPPHDPVAPGGPVGDRCAPPGSAVPDGGEHEPPRVPQQRSPHPPDAGEPLLVVVDPLARRVDIESVRIARDVLRAGAPGVKLCLPEEPEETAAALLRHGRRRPVLVGDDAALQRTLGALHAGGELAVPLAFVPVGQPTRLTVAGGLGVPLDAVTAARAVLRGAERRLDLLADDAGGVAAGALRIPEPPCPPAPAPPGTALLRACRSLVRRRTTAPAPRLRVEADGEPVVPPGAPAAEVAMVTGAGGYADVTVRAAPRRGPTAPAVGGEWPTAADGGGELRVRARRLAVEVGGEGFRYRTGATVDGPVRFRAWRVLPAAWGLVLPRS